MVLYHKDYDESRENGKSRGPTTGGRQAWTDGIDGKIGLDWTGALNTLTEHRHPPLQTRVSVKSTTVKVTMVRKAETQISGVQ